MTKADYLAACEAATQYASGTGEDWNDRYLAGLYRNGLQLTQSDAWLLIYEFAWRAPLPYRGRDQNTDLDLWPAKTWIIPR